MKDWGKKISAIALSLSFAVSFGLSGCNMEMENSTPSIRECTILLLNNHLCQGLGEAKKVQRGEDAVFTFQVKKGYVFESINYRDYEVEIGQPEANGITTVTLTLHGVKYTESLEVSIKEAERTYASEIVYYANGGESLQGSEEMFRVSYNLQNHYRPNTEMGTYLLQREGYVQIGWNTKADGSGIHVGLGSKAPVYDGGSLNLYAEWVRCTPEECFDYILIDKDNPNLDNYYLSKAELDSLSISEDNEDCVAILTGYKGAYAQLVVPEFVDGYEIVGLGEGMVENDETISTVVLPKSIRTVEDLAFKNCPNFKELYIYDNILKLEDNAFGDPFTVETLHINAVRNPIYGKQEAAQVANKVEMLRNHDGIKPKMVVFGSCSTFYGISAAELQDAFPQYDVFNMGVVGGICSKYQIDLIKPSLKEGDVFIYIPELASKYQMLMESDFATNVFTTMENNYDYLAELNMQDYDNIIPSLHLYLFTKKNSSNGSYADFLATMSSKGDLLKERQGGYDNQGKPYEALSAEEVAQSDAFKEMKILFDELDSIGVKSHFAFGPMNEDGLDIRKIEALENLIKEQVERQQIPITFINASRDGVMGKQYFADTNYHLTLEGAKILTRTLIAGLMSFYENKGGN